MPPEYIICHFAMVGGPADGGALESDGIPKEGQLAHLPTKYADHVFEFRANRWRHVGAVELKRK